MPPACDDLHPTLIPHRHFLEVEGSRGCAVNGCWQHNGHISLIARASRADAFNVLNWPAHIQGTPSAFQLRVHAYPDLPPAAITRMRLASAGSAASAAIIACVKSASLPPLQASPFSLKHCHIRRNAAACVTHFPSGPAVPLRRILLCAVPSRCRWTHSA